MFDLVFNSGLFSTCLSAFIVLISYRIAFRLIYYFRDGGYTFQKEPKEPDIKEKEITFYDLLYDDELKELMAKYDELDEQHKKKHEKEKGEY